MNTRRKGNKSENELAELLERAGYYVMRSRASQGLIDLIALPKEGADPTRVGMSGTVANKVLLIQVKSNRHLPSHEWRALHALSDVLYDRNSYEVIGAIRWHGGRWEFKL